MVQSKRSAPPKHPDFIYIGAPKCGTSWLYDALKEHPEIALFPGKSTGFFERESHDTELSEYLTYFAHLPEDRTTGEIAHDTYAYLGNAGRLKTICPDIKILATIREPGNFARSTLTWWSSHSNDIGSSVSEVCQNPLIWNRVDFATQLKPFFDVFPRRQIKVMFYEHLAEDPQKFLQEVFAFLEVDGRFESSVVNTYVNKTRPVRAKWFAVTMFRMADLARRFGLHGAVELIKRNWLLNNLLYAPQSLGKNDLIERKVVEIRTKMRLTFPELQRLIGREVPDSWWVE